MDKEYTLLFNGITDAVGVLDNLAMQLKKLQTEAEELYISREDD